MNSVYTEDGFKYWVKKARPGNQIIYYTGLLMYDREKAYQRGLTVDTFPEDLRAAGAAWASNRQGEVMLFQIKRKHSVYDYVAVKV